MQQTIGLYVHAAFPCKSGNRIEYKVGRADLVLWNAGVVFYMLPASVEVLL